MIAKLKDDARFYFALRHPGRACTRVGLLATSMRSPGMWILATQRIGNAYLQSRATHGWTAGNFALRVIKVPCSVLRILLTKSIISDTANVDGGVYLANGGNLTLGVRRIGRGSMIHECVTVGLEVTNKGIALPIIEENVWIGPGSLVFGEITIGSGATILPGSVVGRSVAAGAVVSGNPARVIARDCNNAVLRETLQADDAYVAAALHLDT